MSIHQTPPSSMKLSPSVSCTTFADLSGATASKLTSRPSRQRIALRLGVGSAAAIELFSVGPAAGVETSRQPATSRCCQAPPSVGLTDHGQSRDGRSGRMERNAPFLYV